MKKETHHTSRRSQNHLRFSAKVDFQFLIKMRDGHQQIVQGSQLIADACEEMLETMRPKETKQDPEDYNNLFWQDVEGKRGPFQRTSKKANLNSTLFQQLQTEIKNHDGFCQIGNCKY